MPNRKTDDMKTEEDRTAEAAPEQDAAVSAEEQGQEPDPLEVARAENAQLKDQLLRALAETENVRRRAQRDREDAAKFAAAPVIRDLLPVADNLRRALESIPAEALQSDELLKTLAEGVEMTERQLLSAFERHSIRKIEPLGEKFDSNLHQAMFEVPGSGQPAGTVVQLLQPGYLLHDRLLRPAMAGVANGEPAANGQGGNEGAGGDGGEAPPPGGRLDTTA
jgi:molecular chaperone GrpE